jgi:hypothetical protein
VVFYFIIKRLNREGKKKIAIKNKIHGSLRFEDVLGQIMRARKIIYIEPPWHFISDIKF